MVSYDELARNLAAVTNLLSNHYSNINHTCSDIRSASNRVLSYFNNQQSGRQLRMSLSTAEGFILSAENALHSLGADISGYINQIRK